MTYLCYNYARKSNTMKQIHRTGSVIMYKIDFNQPCHIHFIGIGGISMSGLAEILLEEGFTVSGSDNKESALTDHLSQNGATVFYGQKASNIIDGIDLVVLPQRSTKTTKNLQKQSVRIFRCYPEQNYSVSL